MKQDTAPVGLAHPLEGIRVSGVAARVDGADLSDTRMSARVVAPEVAVAAPVLLRGYRSPFNGRAGADLPVVWAGFVITHSEVGCGAFSVMHALTSGAQTLPDADADAAHDLESVAVQAMHPAVAG